MRVPAEKIRQKFNSEAARAAFDRINALGPNWVFDDNTPDKPYLSPCIETKTVGGGLLSGIGGFRSDDLDETVIRLERALVAEASRPNKLVIVNAGAESRLEYKYDTASGEFIYFAGKLHSDKPFSIKLKKPCA